MKNKLSTYNALHIYLISGIFMLFIAMLAVFPANMLHKYPTEVIEMYTHQKIVIQKTSSNSSKKKTMYDSELNCLARNIYHESRGETEDGMIAVGLVTINRSQDNKFPKTICGVVYQSHGDEDEKICQFSWTCDLDNVGRPVGQAWSKSMEVAKALLSGGHVEHKEIVDGAKYFHATGVRPSWVKRFTRVTIIGNHVFYK